MQDGIFTQPGPDGMFGRGGPPGDSSSPVIDSDDTPLRETLLVAYPSPGHMRVARAIRHPKSGRTEQQEQYRVPTPEEVEFLKQQGLPGTGAGSVGPGSMVQTGGLGETAPAMPPTDPAAGTAPAGEPSALWTWAKYGAVFAAGAAGFWAVNRWVVPYFTDDRR